MSGDRPRLSVSLDRAAELVPRPAIVSRAANRHDPGRRIPRGKAASGGLHRVTLMSGTSRPPSGIYSLQLSDQSILKVSPAGGGMMDLKVLGRDLGRFHPLDRPGQAPLSHAMANQLLSIRNLDRQVGADRQHPRRAIRARRHDDAPHHRGRHAPVRRPRARRADRRAVGSVGSMSLGDVRLGPTGHVVIAGNVSGTGTGTSTSTGTPPSGTGTSTVTINGTIAGTITATGSGSGFGHDPQHPAYRGPMTIDNVAIDGGRFLIVGDSAAPIQVPSSLSLSQMASFPSSATRLGLSR